MHGGKMLGSGGERILVSSFLHARAASAPLTFNYTPLNRNRLK